MMRLPLIISVSGHALILLAAIATVPEARQLPSSGQAPIAVEIVSFAETSERAAASPENSETDQPQPPDRERPKPSLVQSDIVKEKRTTPAASSSPARKKPPPEPRPRQQAVKPALQPEKIVKIEAPQPQRRPTALMRRAHQPPPKPETAANLTEIAALLDKRDQPPSTAPAHRGETGTPLQADYASVGQDMQLSATAFDWLRQRIGQCWSIPAGVRNAENLVVVLEVEFDEYGFVKTPPVVVNELSHPAFWAGARSAIAAIMGCQPFDRLPQEQYAAWRVMRIRFDPGDMLASSWTRLNGPEKTEMSDMRVHPHPLRAASLTGSGRRRWMLAPLMALGMILAHTGAALAVLDVEVNRGRVDPVLIALPDFLGETDRERRLGHDMVTVIGNDLARSGLFAPLDQASHIASITDFDSRPLFGDWRAIRAQALVIGRIVTQPDNRLRAEFRLWDTLTGQQLAGLQFVTQPENWRRMGHLIADAVYQAITGEDGYFDTRIVFVEETGPKDNRIKRLAIMDQDGHNLSYLTDGAELVLTPRFNPSSQEITYMSYAGGKPRVYLLNIETRQREIVGVFPNMSFAPRFSPDGRKVALSLQHGKSADIYVLDLGSRDSRRLTHTPSIDTAPSYSPDGSQIVFESDRDGTQQIYVMTARGKRQTRISFGQGRYSTPVWSPRGDYIAFTKMDRGRFAIGVMRPDGTGERILTEGFHNEGPTWAPNGRVLMFFRSSRGETGGPRLFSVDLTGHNERPVPTGGFASDPAWSPLLK